MNIEITSLKPFMISFNIYNLLGEIDGHPKVRFNMVNGTYSLVHDKTFGNLVSTLDHTLKDQPLVISNDSPMFPTVNKQIQERIQHTGFDTPDLTKALNPYYSGDLKYPRYFFIMWNEDGSYRFINQQDYNQIASNF